MYALNLAEDNRILSATFEEYATADMPKVDTLPDGDITDYLYVDGQYVYEPLPEPGPAPTEPTADEEDWKPDITPALYTPIGLTEEGYPVWSQPSGAQDAYNTGDIVNYNGTLYKSLIDGNVWSPEANPAGWKKVI